MEVNLNINRVLLYLCAKLRHLALREGGQDLVEYALLLAMIAFAASAGMKQVASGINNAFSNIASQLDSTLQPPTQ